LQNDYFLDIFFLRRDTTTFISSFCAAFTLRTSKKKFAVDISILNVNKSMAKPGKELCKQFYAPVFYVTNNSFFCYSLESIQFESKRSFIGFYLSQDDSRS